MPRTQAVNGICAYCEQEVAKNAVTKHLSTCPQRREALAKAEASKNKSENLYHLRIQAAYLKDFWLDLEMRSSATLEDLDEYLRAIWLECCGHMSMFSPKGWGSDEIPKSRKAEQVFHPGDKLVHIYDFGTESETHIAVSDVREGKATTKHPIALLVRNLQPKMECIECGKPAAWFCNECFIEEETSGTLCNDCVEEHPHDNYGDPIELCNSPRMGMCGYEGPADPPY
ncbi:MAG: hypothetical protein JST85_16915 [Acidobacteria bacterium]|nr:hypothetical protein [Acidobacteriota bacterium]